MITKTRSNCGYHELWLPAVDDPYAIKATGSPFSEQPESVMVNFIPRGKL